mmetsp:Transcript_29678/g.94978  ORF Transcript_29678/g.94978 Transcript_29678/m.94978 type:complete len:230 (-) Transcript_29678:117-806(-)
MLYHTIVDLPFVDRSCQPRRHRDPVNESCEPLLRALAIVRKHFQRVGPSLHVHDGVSHPPQLRLAGRQHVLERLQHLVACLDVQSQLCHSRALPHVVFNALCFRLSKVCFQLLRILPQVASSHLQRVSYHVIVSIPHQLLLDGVWIVQDVHDFLVIGGEAGLILQMRLQYAVGRISLHHHHSLAHSLSRTMSSSCSSHQNASEHESFSSNRKFFSSSARVVSSLSFDVV